MKILSVADLHYSLPQFDWVLRMAPRYDLVVIAGDLLDAQSAVSVSAQMAAVLKYLEKLRERTTVLVCSGNHDLNHQYSTGEKYARWVQYARSANLHADGDNVPIGNADFSVFPWWDGGIAQRAIARQLGGVTAQQGRDWIWIYHAPPTEAAVSWSGSRHYGDESLAGWIRDYQPRMVLTGHVHEAPFARGGSWVERIGDTWVFNAGKQIGDIPTHIVVDTDRGEAVWFSLEGVEWVDFDSASADDRVALSALPDWIPLQGAPSSSRESPDLGELGGS